MTLAPIRGAPAGAFIPDFPGDASQGSQPQPAAAPLSADQAQPSSMRQPQTPIEIGGSGVTLTFRIIPEIPAIGRASMTIHVVADPVGPASSHGLGSLRMSAANARAFLTDLRDGQSPTVGIGDEGGTLEILYEITQGQSALLVRKPDQQQALHRFVIDRNFDLTRAADELLADLGV